MKTPVDISGQRFGSLVAIHPNGRRWSFVTWLCNCDCGGTITTTTGSLRSGNTRSCGKCSRIVHGAARKQSVSPEYRVWLQMRQRCSNPKCEAFRLYGGRGISVCERWQTFANFISDMGACPAGYSLDRINNDGHYEPGNCRWTTWDKQASNKSTSRLIEVDGEVQCITEWSRRHGVSPNGIKHRLNKGWSPERAVKEPVAHRYLLAKRGHL